MNTSQNFASLLGEKGTTGSKYVKRKLIGTGSYGEAFLVERATDQAIFVAKVMDLGKMSARDKQYAYSEIKCLAHCKHPNIIAYEEDHEEDDKLLIIMEYADAGDLDRQVKSRAADNFRYFQEHEVLFLYIQLCLSIDHVHRHRMLHRDIKGANILLCSSGLIKIGDFGFSHQYEDTVSGVVANTFCGTPYYLAPELWNNQRYSKKADVWSLGILMYEIMALKRPFTATNMKSLMQKVVKGEIPDMPSHYSKDVHDIIRYILVTDANARPTVCQVLQLPQMQNGLKLFIETIKKNSRISDSVKAALVEHSELIGSAPLEITSKKQGEIDMEISQRGMVKKYGGAQAKGWKDRFLILKQGHLLICETESDEANAKALSLQHIQSVCPVPPSSSGLDFVFALNTVGGKSMWLAASSNDEMELWIHQLQLALGIA